jgi:hypothetical protein
MSCSAASVSKQRADINIWTCSVIRSRTIKPPECVIHADLTISSYKSIILPSVLYGPETWFLTLQERHILRMSENKVLSRIFGTMRGEETER